MIGDWQRVNIPRYDNLVDMAYVRIGYGGIRRFDDPPRFVLCICTHVVAFCTYPWSDILLFWRSDIRAVYVASCLASSRRVPLHVQGHDPCLLGGNPRRLESRAEFTLITE